MASQQDILKTIVERKQAEIEAARRAVPESRLAMEARNFRQRRPFLPAVASESGSKIHVIAEIKRASPSRGMIRPDIDPGEFARTYECGGAAAVSVLTDRDFFKGSPEDLTAARESCRLPVLRKDFLISSYQIYESAVLGADACLLIVRILEAPALTDYISLCAELGMEALVEAHTAEEIETAKQAGARLVGINNRNLQSFETDVRRSAALADVLGPGQTPVAESGIRSRADIERLFRAGIKHFLIGESVVRSEDPAAFLQSLTKDML